MLQSFSAQHDESFQAPTNGEGPSYFPNEEFFIRPIGEDLDLTGRQLRLEEDEIFQKRRTTLEAEFPNELFHHRDFYALCRGIEWVRTIDGYLNARL